MLYSYEIHAQELTAYLDMIRARLPSFSTVKARRLARRDIPTHTLLLQPLPPITAAQADLYYPLHRLSGRPRFQVSSSLVSSYYNSLLSSSKMEEFTLLSDRSSC
jgi:hypothetical protein